MSAHTPLPVQLSWRERALKAEDRERALLDALKKALGELERVESYATEPDAHSPLLVEIRAALTKARGAP